MTLLESFLAAFIPIFIAMDAIGVLPFYISMTDGLKPNDRRRVLYQAVLTAAAVGLAFILLGKLVFSFLGITVSDFKVAGGLILVVLAVSEILFPDQVHHKTVGAIGVVPLGVPLIVGPAVLTSLIVQVDFMGAVPTLTAFAVNLILAYIVFRSDRRMIRVLGQSGTEAISKVANLLLAAYGVMTIRVGILELLASR
jgi:multiple antibiotic resistance protein